MFGQLPEPPPAAGAGAASLGAVLWLLSPCWVWVVLESDELESLDWAYATAEYPPTRAPATASVARPLRQRVMVITSSRSSRCSVVPSKRRGVRTARESRPRRVRGRGACFVSSQESQQCGTRRRWTSRRHTPRHQD